MEVGSKSLLVLDSKCLFMLGNTDAPACFECTVLVLSVSPSIPFHMGGADALSLLLLHIFLVTL